MSGKLYIVATPIGNSGDMTDRARQILSESNIVAAEDTRVTQRLLNELGIKNKTVSNHKFNEKKQVDYLISELLLGNSIAVVSDAGTPCISDPGHVIVKSAVENGVDVIAVCGASAVTSALSVSGFDFVTFAFCGFFPRTAKEIKKLATQLNSESNNTFVFFESPMRIKKTVQLLAEELHDAEICLCNDLTKVYERIYRGFPDAVFKELSENPSAEKGEYVMVLHIKSKPKLNSSENAVSLEAMLIDCAIKHSCTIKESVKLLTEKHKGKITKNDFYAASVNLKEIVPGLFPYSRDSDIAID